MEAKVKTELLELASRVTDEQKKQQLTDLINREHSLRYVTAELANAVGLNSKEKARATELFVFFW